MGKLRFSRLSGATLVETIVALVIILVIFSIVTTFLVQTSLDSFSLRGTRAAELVNNYAAETKEKKAFFDEEVEYDDMYARREVSSGDENKNLVRVTFSIFDRNHKLITSQDRLFCPK